MAVVNEARQGGWRCWFAKKEKKRDGGGGCSVLVREGQIFGENFWQ